MLYCACLGAGWRGGGGDGGREERRLTGRQSPNQAEELALVGGRADMLVAADNVRVISAMEGRSCGGVFPGCCPSVCVGSSADAD